MATPIADIDIGVNLIDNYLYVMDSPVVQDPDGRFLVVQNPATLKSSTGQASELLTVDGDGNLVHYIPDTKSNSGWSKTAVPNCTPPAYGLRDTDTSTTILRLAGFYDQGGILNVLVYFSTSKGDEPSCATWMQKAVDGTWSNATGILSKNAKNALACTYQTDVYVDANGRGYFYGVSAYVSGGGFFIAAYDATADKIDLIFSYDLQDFLPAPGLTEQAAFRMAAGSSGNDVTILWVDTPKGGSNTEIYYQGATITYGRVNTTFAWSNGNTLSPAVFKPAVGTFSVGDLKCLPGAFGADAVLLRNGSDVLYLVSGYNSAKPALTPLTGGTEQPTGSIAATIGQDANGVMNIFAIEKGTTNLWYLQQQQAGGGFGTWVNLAGTYSTIASPSSMAFGPELFAVDLSYDIYHQARTLADQVWITGKVAEPSPSSADNDQPQNIAGFNMEVTALDDTGAPIPNAIVYLGADHPATVVINSLSYCSDTATRVPVETDPNGQATITYQAVDLKPPQFTLSSNADGSGVTKWCQSDVVQDDDPATPPATSVSSQLSNATQQQLTDNNLIDSSYSDPSCAVKAINAAGSWMNPNHANAGMIDTSRIAVKHWTLDFTAKDGPQFKVLSDAEADALRQNALGSSGVFGDACHFFKNAWDKLETFSASVKDDVLTVVLNGASWAIQTVKQAGDALETVFTRIMQGLKDLYQILKDVLDWLKMLFEWSDILNTHNVLKAVINSTFDNIEGSMSGAEKEFNAWFQTLKSDVAAAFKDLGQFGDQTFNEFVNGISDPKGPKAKSGSTSNVLDGTSQKQTYKAHSARCNFAHRQVLSSYGNKSVTPLSASAAPATTVSMDSIIAAFNKDIDQTTFNSKSESLQKFLQNPSELFDNGIANFCETGIEDLCTYVLDAADDIVDAAIDEIEDALTAYMSLVNASIHIPILSWIYKYEITGSVTHPGDDLTVLDLICLVNAIPATILCKLVTDRAPFTSSSAGVIKQYGMPWPSAPFLSAEGDTLAGGKPVGDMPSEMQEVLYWLQLAGVFVQLFGGALCDGIGDAYAVNEMEEEEKSEVATWVSGINVVSQICLYGIGAPWPQFYKSASELTITDKAILASWAWSTVPIVIDVVCLASEKVQVKFESGYGPVLAGCLGVISEGFGIWTAVEMASHESEGYDGYSIAEGFTGNISASCKFLILGGDDTLYVLLPVDFFTAVANLMLAEFSWSEETPPS